VKFGISLVVGLVALAACTQTVPDSGVGFGDVSDFEARAAAREAALSGITPELGRPITAMTPAGQNIPAQELREAGIGASTAPLSAINVGADPGRTQGVDATPGNPEPVLTNNPGISDEQDFDAVASRESIQSDAERRAAQAAAREVIEPTALPTRSSTAGPNIVEYAINAPNVRGQEWYSRSLLSGQARMQRNCAKYNTPDAAQRDFLARGGPERDRLGIDPDGDGFACGWDPAPFKLAAGN